MDDFELFLVQRTWRFERADGSIISHNLRLKPGGSIAGHKNRNELSWQFNDGSLEFRNWENHVTTRFESVVADQQGKLILQGRFLNTDVFHVLKEDRTVLKSGPPNESPRVAVLVRTHVVNEKLFDLLDVLNKSRRYDLFVTADETRGVLNVSGYEKLPHSIDSCKEHDLSVNHDHIFWMCGDYPLYFAAAQIPNYDYYIMVEFDVEVVRGNPLFLEGLISRLQNEHDSHYDFVCANFAEAHPAWAWTKNASLSFPKAYSSGLFSFLVISKSALLHLFSARKAEAAREVPSDEIIHCEAFCASALVSGGFRCASINTLIEGAVERETFHPPIPSLENSWYLLNDHQNKVGCVELMHPVYDLEMYLKRQFSKAESSKSFEPFLERIGKIEPENANHANLISNYAKLATTKLANSS